VNPLHTPYVWAATARGDGHGRSGPGVRREPRPWPPTNITHVEPTAKLPERLQEAPVVPGGTLPGREVAVTSSHHDLSIQRIIRIPG